MHEVTNSSKDLQNCDIELKKEEPSFRTVKSCPNCHSIIVTYRKWKGAYWCGNCQESFKDPVFKQIKDRRNELPIPPTLKKATYHRSNE
jgi:ribosomal protein L37AE/L43A